MKEGEYTMEQRKSIYFYSWKKQFFEFSNFSLHPIVIDGKTYKTNEHYFQSVKFLDPDYQEKIRLASSPKEAKILGSSRDYAILPNWNTKRIDVMKTCLLAKFTQHENLKTLLLSTENALLVEDSPSDTFWGCGKNKNGQNMLGQLLMELRTELKNK